MVDTRTTFFSLPPEVREQIYSLILNPDANRIYLEDEYTNYNYKDALALFLVDRQVYYESRKIFRDLNIFVRIETPLPQAKEHVTAEGHVPIVMSDQVAVSFKGVSMMIMIDAPEAGVALDSEKMHFVILLDDLPKFTRLWYYSDLSYPVLNRYLRLTLRLNAPYTPEWEEQRMLKSLQRKLILPFGEVKGLSELRFLGNLKPYKSIVDELHAEQAKAHKSPEHCLRDASKLLAEGDVALKAKRSEEALETYKRAWEALHIVIRGAKRHVHADAFFGRTLSEEPYNHKNGQAERLLIRLELVASTCAAHLDLGQYTACRLWGLRTIVLLREAMGLYAPDLEPEEEAVVNFPAATTVGSIYLRTGLACTKLGERQEARRLLLVAREYLPYSEAIDREIAACET